MGDINEVDKICLTCKHLDMELGGTGEEIYECKQLEWYEADNTSWGGRIIYEDRITESPPPCDGREWEEKTGS